MLTLLVALLACSTPSPDVDVDPEGPGAPVVSPAETHRAHAEATAAAKASAPTLSLSLNGTEKWQMDEHTRGVVKETHVTLMGGDTSSVEGLQGLGNSLKEHTDGLIQGCTMEGAAHDELHVFLMAWIPSVESLRTTSDLEAGQATAAELKAMLETYGQHFE